MQGERFDNDRLGGGGAGRRLYPVYFLPFFLIDSILSDLLWTTVYVSKTHML